MSNLPTAEELFIQLGFMPKENQLGYDIKAAMIEFAKLHVEAALKAASENGKIILDKDWVRKEQTIHPNQLVGPVTIKVYSESILNAYPLENIK